MSNEKRESTRQAMFRVCRYNIDGREYADLSTNISERGIFIKNLYPPALGTKVSLSVTLPDSWGKQPIKIVGRVAWVNEGEDTHKRGMGIEFVSVQAETIPIIEYFVKEVYEQDKLKKNQLRTTQSNTEDGKSGQSFEYDLDLDIEVNEPQ